MVVVSAVDDDVGAVAVVVNSHSPCSPEYNEQLMLLCATNCHVVNFRFTNK